VNLSSQVSRLNFRACFLSGPCMLDVPPEPWSNRPRSLLTVQIKMHVVMQFFSILILCPLSQVPALLSASCCQIRSTILKHVFLAWRRTSRYTLECTNELIQTVRQAQLTVITFKATYFDLTYRSYSGLHTMDSSNAMHVGIPSCSHL
jgi:hypothetical protein